MPNIEELIRAAMREGKFENLPGKGKPLKLEDNPHANPDWRLAHHILREGGFTLPWIEKRHEIEVDLAQARADLLRAWNWHEDPFPQDLPRDQVEKTWCDARETFRGQVQTLNKRIADYNLEAPSDQFQMRSLNYEREITSLTESHTR